ncbi:biotin/lipoyl-binding carrier protein [Pseudonocardia terrae]|uniref:biotin/lipoyl-binding carrier protein n=1 Tax=Pseudonocardia terrae TaxID=2905831 RepID=UPI002107E512|nr:biotin/lipoyl-binding carrier protein [Pseudonocardia terrae]
MADIRSEMMGSVVRIPVTEGSRLAAGDTVAVIECMKTEIPILAERAGTVTKVAVAEGAAVENGDLLVVLD